LGEGVLCGAALDGLDARTRRALGDAWLADAQMEHASVAAFGRFVLQLLALGAPSELVSNAAQAVADEVRHAEMCFGIAARFDGIPRAPMPLALDGVLASRTLAEVTFEVVLEGCVGETVAALIAARALEGATDPEVRWVLEQVAADEARHSALAWRFVRWALRTGGDDVRLSAQRAFAESLEPSTQGVTSSKAARDADAIAWRSFGRLSETELNSAFRSAKTEIIAPCARALFSAA
jgi:hypothetical protein